MSNDTYAKEEKTDKCEEYRTISLISHTSTILTQIVHRKENRRDFNKTSIWV